MNITVILNIFKRPQWFKEQLQSILNQTIKPQKIIIWNNANNDIDLTEYKLNKDLYIIIDSSVNLGVWARFYAVYPILTTDYICVLDDDTIPGCKWFENCISTITQTPALLGTIGVYFNSGKTYNVNMRRGWDNPCDSAVIVDIVGHNWFFKKEWITTIIKDIPGIEQYLTCGEDIHLSYTLAKYLNIPTIVPPHPIKNKDMWGANKEKSIIYGNINSTFVNTGINKFSEALELYISKGFETIFNKALQIKIYNKCLEYFLNKIRNNESFSLLRYADGEHLILENKTFTNIDNWTFVSNSPLQKHLKDSLGMVYTNVYYGVSGKSDNLNICLDYFKWIKNTHNITFANIFVNSNYKKWLNFINIECNRPCIFIGPKKMEYLGSCNVIENITISEVLVNTWDNIIYETYKNIMSSIAKKYTNTIFFISAGPLSCLFIKFLYETNPNNTYIDIGSSLDQVVKQKITRDYQATNNIDSTDIINMPTYL